MFLTNISTTHIAALLLLLALLPQQMQASPRHRRSDDETLRSVQDVVQDQARVIQSLQASLTALESKVQSQQSAINSLQVRENHESNAGMRIDPRLVAFSWAGVKMMGEKGMEAFALIACCCCCCSLGLRD